MCDPPFPILLLLRLQLANGGSPKRDDGRHYDSQREHLLSFNLTSNQMRYRTPARNPNQGCLFKGRVGFKMIARIMLTYLELRCFSG